MGKGFCGLAVAALVWCVMAWRESEGADGSADEIALRVLYVGHPGTSREKDFVGFLETHFAKVGKGDLAKFTGVQADGFDVVVMDYDGDGFNSPRPGLRWDYTRATVTVGVTGAHIGGQMNLKTGYL